MPRPLPADESRAGSWDATAATGPGRPSLPSLSQDSFVSDVQYDRNSFAGLPSVEEWMDVALQHERSLSALAASWQTQVQLLQRSLPQSPAAFTDGRPDLEYTLIVSGCQQSDYSRMDEQCSSATSFPSPSHSKKIGIEDGGACTQSGPLEDVLAVPCSNENDIDEDVVMVTHTLWLKGNGISKKLSASGNHPEPDFLITSAKSNHPTGDMVEAKNWARFIVIHPSGPQRVTWDVLSLFMVAYEALTLPLMAFHWDELPEIEPLRKITSVFWLVDIFMTFRTGYHDDGIVIGVPSRIAKHYLMRSFIIDLLIVGIDWVSLVTPLSEKEGLADTADIARIGKIVRVIRLLRILKLIRMAKFVTLSIKFTDLAMCVVSDTDTAWEFLGMSKLLFSLMIMCHFIACLWYALGESGLPGDSWLNPLVAQDATMVHCYAVAFHWAMAQCTPAPSNYHPQNVHERIFAIGILLFGFTMFTSFLGSISGLFTQIRKEATRRAENDMRIRKFLSQNCVSMQLGNRIFTFMRNHQRRGSRRVLQKDVPLLDLLPGSLTMELHYEMYSGTLEDHPLLLCLGRLHQGFMCNLCHEAMHQRLLSPHHELFRVGAVGSAAFCSVSDGLSYSARLHSGESKRASRLSSRGHMQLHTKVLDAGSWLCEASLWVKWLHRGQATADSPCLLVVLGSEAFRDVAAIFPDVLEVCRHYVRLFSAKMSSLLPEDQLDYCNKDICRELVAGALEASGYTPPPILTSQGTTTML